MKKITINFTSSISGLSANYAIGQTVTLPEKKANEFINAKLAIKVGADGKAKQTIVELNGQIDVLEKTISKTENELVAAGKKIANLEKDNNDYQDLIADQKDEIHDLKLSNDLFAKSNLDLTGKIGELTGRLNQAEKQIADLLHSETGDVETGDTETGDVETGDVETVAPGPVVETGEADAKTVEPVPVVSPKIETKPDGTKAKAMPKKKTQPNSN